MTTDTSKPEEKFSKNSIVSGIGWKFLERISSLVVTLVVQIVLARLLNPADFGLAAMVMVFVSLSTIFVTGGLSNSLIQKTNADELDFSTLFWLNILVSVLIYVLLFLFAPFVEAFYGYPQLSAMLRVLSLRVIIASVNSIQTAYISRNMMFRYYFYSTLSGKIFSGVIGIGMAFLGFGVWSLVGQSLSVLLVETYVLWFKGKWRPKRIFSWSRAKSLYSFAWKIMVMSWVELIHDQLRNMIIGKKYSSEELAFYDKGLLLPTNIMTNIAASLTTVMFPVLSHSQDENERVLGMCRKWLSLFAYCAFPILTFFIVSARQIILVLFTAKWLPSLLFLQLASFYYAVWVIEIPIRETIKSLGHAQICLRMQVIKTLFALILLFSIMSFGVEIIAVSSLVSSLFNVFVSMYYGNKYIQYSPKELLADILPTLVLNVIMGMSIFLVALLPIPNILILILQTILGAVVYLGISFVLRNENYHFLRDLIRERLSL